MGAPTPVEGPDSVPHVNALFQQPWWLDAVAPAAWGVASVGEGDDVRARMPYVLGRRGALRVVRMPPLTQTLGPWIAPSTGKYATRLSKERVLVEALLDQLPPFDHFSQTLHHTQTDWLAFRWRGFEQTTRYTYVLEDLSDVDAVWKGFRDNIRREIRKAGKGLEVRTGLDVDRFVDLHRATFTRQELEMPYGAEVIRRIDAACGARECRRIFHAEDAEGRVHAAVFVVWDEHAAYYLMGGTDPDVRNSGAMSLLLWEAIQFAAGVTRRFDFEGSMLQPVERFFRGFGAVQKPYFEILGSSRRMRVLLAGRDLLRAVFVG